jgi:hypothetical protein
MRPHEAKDCVLGGSAGTLADSGGMVGTHALLTVQSALYDYGQLMSGSEKVLHPYPKRLERQTQSSSTIGS